MKRKILCTLLSLAMVVTMMPMMTMTAFAGDEQDYSVAWNLLAQAMYGKNLPGVEGVYSASKDEATQKITVKLADGTEIFTMLDSTAEPLKREIQLLTNITSGTLDSELAAGKPEKILESIYEYKELILDLGEHTLSKGSESTEDFILIAGNMDNQDEYSVTIKNGTLSGGNNPSKNMISAKNAGLNIEGLTFDRQHSNTGTAVYFGGGKVTIKDCIFNGLNYNGEKEDIVAPEIDLLGVKGATISGCTFSGYNENKDCIKRDSLIKIEDWTRTEPVTFENSIIKDNKLCKNCYAVSVGSDEHDGSDLIIKDCNFSNNISSKANGGGTFYLDGCFCTKLENTDKKLVLCDGESGDCSVMLNNSANNRNNAQLASIDISALSDITIPFNFNVADEYKNYYLHYAFGSGVEKTSLIFPLIKGITDAADNRVILNGDVSPLVPVYQDDAIKLAYTGCTAAYNTEGTAIEAKQGNTKMSSDGITYQWYCADLYISNILDGDVNSISDFDKENSQWQNLKPVNSIYSGQIYRAFDRELHRGDILTVSLPGFEQNSFGVEPKEGKSIPGLFNKSTIGTPDATLTGAVYPVKNSDGSFSFPVDKDGEYVFGIYTFYGNSDGPSYVVSDVSLVSAKEETKTKLEGETTDTISNDATLAGKGYSCEITYNKPWNGNLSNKAFSNWIMSNKTEVKSHSHGEDGAKFEKMVTNLDELKALFAEGGSGYLAANIVTTETLLVGEGKTVSLCLDGRSIELNGSGSAIEISQTATLNICDCDTRKEEDRTHAGYTDNDGLWHLGSKDSYSEGETVKPIIGGLITGGKGSGISVAGTLNMDGGTVAGNTCGVDLNGNMNICGTVVIDGNVDEDASATNLKIGNNGKLDITENKTLDDGSHIGITMESIGAFLPTETDISECFSSDDIDREVKFENNYLNLVEVTKYYNILIKTNGYGSAIAMVNKAEVTSAAKNTIVKLVVTPQKGYDFNGWKSDSGLTIVDDSFTMPDHDVTITATFKKNTDITPLPIIIPLPVPTPTPVPAPVPVEVEKYLVNFDMQGHGNSLLAVLAEKDSKIAEPVAPAAEGWNFEGWFKEAECINAWDFEKDTVTADTVLYAKWTEVAPEPLPEPVKVPVELVKATASGDTAVKLTWLEVDGATKYYVYGNRCGSDYKAKLLATTTKNTYTVKKINGKKLTAHKAYKFYVIAQTDTENVRSKTIHFFTANTKGDYANVKSIKANESSIDMTVGEMAKVGATYKMYKGKKHISSSHGKALRYISDCPEVVSVSSTGKVIALREGAATIYIQDVGGKFCKVKVTVE